MNRARPLAILAMLAATCAAAPASRAAPADARAPPADARAPPADARAESPAPSTIDELVVTGERTGPGLWHVHAPAGSATERGEAWILGTVSPLPKSITWRSREVEALLGRTNVVLVNKPFEIGIVRGLWLYLTQRSVFVIPDGRRLVDVMPADLYRRFELLRLRYTRDADKWSRYRPIIATAFLEQAALHQVGLSARLDIGAEVRTLARRRDVPIEELKVAGVRDFIDALKTMPKATEMSCVAGALATIESGLPRLIARAEAWATGNIERIQSLPEPREVDACFAALAADAGAADLLTQFRRTWVDNLDAHLRAGDRSLAVVNMDLLLERGGLIDALRARGYAVDPP
jgi:uncharacterized protein YbaP (TraB family)